MYSLKKYAGLGTVASINLVLQFVFQWYIIVFFGAGTQTDVFFGTMVLPQFILLILSSSLTMVLMPMIAKSDQDEFATEAWSYFLGVGLLFAGIVIVLVLTAGYWVAWILPGFRSADHTLAVNLARIQSVSMFFTALLSVVWSIQGAKNNFVLIEKSSIIANSLALLLLIFTIKRFGIYAAAWISVIRVLLQVLFLMKVMGPYPGFHFRTVSFKQAWKKLRPLVAGNMYYKTDMLADRYLTSLGSRGELTLLNLAQQLYSVGNTILVKVFVNTMIPEMARATAANDVERYNQLLKKRLLLSFVSSVFVLITIVFAGKWALGYFFSFKNFTVADVLKLWWLLILLAGYWVAALLGSVSSAAFYAKGNTVTPTVIGVVVFTLYIPIKIFCYYKFGVEGLAISISAYYIASFLVQAIFLRKHLQ